MLATYRWSLTGNTQDTVMRPGAYVCQAAAAIALAMDIAAVGSSGAVAKCARRPAASRLAPQRPVGSATAADGVGVGSDRGQRQAGGQFCKAASATCCRSSHVAPPAACTATPFAIVMT